MPLNGKIGEYSLPEVFRTIEQGAKTGVLTIRECHTVDFSTIFGKTTDISFKDGFCIAATNDPLKQDLVEVIRSNQILAPQEIQSAIKINDDFKLNMPLGKYCISNGLLSQSQLQTLFDLQIVQRVKKLLEVPEGWFTFSARLRTPMIELTGLRVRPTELNLVGLRGLNQWDHFLKKVPDPSFALFKREPKASGNASSDSLDIVSFSGSLLPLEEQILQKSDGTMTIERIANLLSTSTHNIQKVAFQLISAGLVEELPIASAVKVSQSIPQTSRYNSPADRTRVVASKPVAPALRPPQLSAQTSANSSVNSASAVLDSRTSAVKAERSNSLPETKTKPANPVKAGFLKDLSGFLKSRMSSS